jgi:hypothetical protein
MICVLVLQDGVGFVEGETGSCSATCVTCDVDGNDKVSIKVEDEMSEAITFPEIKTEHEVRLWGVCEVAARAFRSFIAREKTFVLLCLCILIVVYFMFWFSVSLFCSVYHLCVNVYCTTATGCQPNCR